MVRCILLLLSIVVAPAYGEAGHHAVSEEVLNGGFDCTGGFDPKWKSVQKTHCCLQEGVCQPEASTKPAGKAAHNCMQGLHQWEKTWSKAKKTWCCNDIGLGCSPDIEAPPAPSSESRWVSMGADKACRLNRDDDSPKGDGMGTVLYQGYPFDQTLQECKLYCESTWREGRPKWLGKAPPKCMGIEQKGGHCEIWTHQIGYSAGATGFACWSYSPNPVILQGASDDKVLVVQADGSVKATRFTARAQDVFHKITNEDNTVSFLSAAGKYVSAKPSGAVEATSGSLGDWEKFYESPHGDSFAYRSFHHKYLIVLVDDGTLKNTAAQVNDRTKLRVNPIHVATDLAHASSADDASGLYAIPELPSWFQQPGLNVACVVLSAVLVGSVVVGVVRASRGQHADGNNRELGVARGESGLRFERHTLGEAEQPLTAEREQSREGEKQSRTLV